MKFLKSLSKGFIRSAINQVGRDGGRVISNQLYGDAHSIPIRGAGKPRTNSEMGVSGDSQDLPLSRERLLEAGYKEEIFSSGVVMGFFLLIGSIAIPFLGSLYWMFWGISNLLKNKTNFYGYFEEPEYKVDRRYSTGKRLVGYSLKKNYSEPVPASSSERIIYRTKGFLGITLSIGLFIFWLKAWVVIFPDDSTNLQIYESEGLAIAIKKTALHKTPELGSEKIISVYPADTLQLAGFTEFVLSSDSSVIWHKVFYKGITGWAYTNFSPPSQ